MFAHVRRYLLETIWIPCWLAFSATVIGAVASPRVEADAQEIEVYPAHSSGIEILDARAGIVCLIDDAPDHVCRPAYTIPIIGDSICAWSEDIDYPCTHYGYELDLANVREETDIICEVANSIRTTFGPETEEVTGRNTARYTETLQVGQTTLFHPSYHTYGPVEKETAVISVHACKVNGALLYQVSYRALYVPEKR